MSLYLNRGLQQGPQMVIEATAATEATRARVVLIAEHSTVIFPSDKVNSAALPSSPQKISGAQTGETTSASPVVGVRVKVPHLDPMP